VKDKCDVDVSVSAGVSPLSARPDVVSVPVHVAVSVTACTGAAAWTLIVKSWVIVPPTGTTTAAGSFVNVKPVYAPSSTAASTVAVVPPVLPKVTRSTSVVSPW